MDAAIAQGPEELKKLIDEGEIPLGASADYYDKELREVQGVVANLNRITEQHNRKQARAQRAAEAEMREIGRLARVAREGDLKTQEEALNTLDKLRDKLISKQKVVKRYSGEWFQMEEKIIQINQVRADREKDVNEKLDERISKLGKLMEHDIDSAASMDELLKLREANNKALAEAIRLKQNDRALDLRERGLAIDEAISSPTNRRQARIEELSGQMSEPGKRKEAERELLQIRRELSKEILNANLLQRDTTKLVEQQVKVEEILKEHHQMSRAEINQQLSLANRLARDARTRDKAEQIYVQMQEEINKQLRERKDLTETERKQLEAILELIGVRLSKIKAPVTVFVKDWKNAWEEMGDAFVDGLATRMADAWMDTATLMFRDINNLKEATTTLFQGMGKALANELREMAKLRVKQHLAEAIGKFAEAAGFAAHGNFASAATAAKSGAQHLLSAAAWSALGGAATALGGKGVDPALSRGRNSDRSTGRSADDANKQGPIIYLRIDGMDPKNARHQQLAGQAVQNWMETTGGKVFKVGG